jgi:trimeric autotransporter adhesin
MKKAFTPSFRISELRAFQKLSYSKLPLCCIVLMLSLNGFSALGQVTGTVFRDFNSNGLKQNTAIFNEPGVAGVSVKAFDASGAQVGTTATTASDGTYTIAGVSGPVRVEFSALPSAYFSGPVGGLSNTTVQFITAPSTANLGINVPDDYCQANPKVVIPCYVEGNVDGHTLVTFPYSYTNDIDGNINKVTTAFPSRDATLGPTAIAENSDFGTSYGIAYDRLNQDIYVGAYVKRKARLSAIGNQSPGAIYKLDNPASATPIKSLYVDLNAVFPGSAGANPHPIATTNWNDDTLTVAKVFKTGLGDIEISKDFTKLYAVNLNDKKLYQIPTSGTLNNTTINSFAIPTANLPITNKAGSFCPTADVRPFGLGRDINGNIYVGGTCTAETSQDKKDLTGYVWKFDGTSFSLVLDFAMDYGHGYSTFLPWKNLTASTSYPMGIVSDIEFDINGDMILGIRDRFGDIVPIANNNGGDPWYPRTAGDILRACLQVNNTFKIENNATCGSITTAGVGTLGDLTSNGPGGKEFYFEETPGDAGTESSQGSLLLLPGSGEVMSNSFDPVNRLGDGTRPKNNYDTGGVQKHSNTTGKQTGAYDVYLSADANTFGKATGLGDIEIMCDLAPIEIGNRVWLDNDKDGIQDADEVGIAGVTVTLCLASAPNTPIATATTDANGNYIFSTAAGTNSGSSKYGLNLTSNSMYILKFPTAVQGKGLTATTAGINTGIDSNADAAGNVPFTLGTTGQNNHTYDVGYSCPSPNCGTVTVIKN